MGVFRFVPSNVLVGSGISGSIDATYNLSWLTDGNPGTPIQRTGALSYTITPPGSVTADVFAIANHTISVNASVSGGATATILAAALERAGIRYNPYALLDTPVTFSAALTLAISGNPVPNVIGEFYAGLSDVLDYDFALDFDPGSPFSWEGEFGSIPPYDPGLSEPRRLVGDLLLTEAGFTKVKNWYKATARGTLPSLVIPDDDVNDAWMCVFRYAEQWVDQMHQVHLEIVEMPRSAW